MSDVVDPKSDPGGFYSRRQQSERPSRIRSSLDPALESEIWSAFCAQNPERIFRLDPASLWPAEYESWNQFRASYDRHIMREIEAELAGPNDRVTKRLRTGGVE